MKNVIIQTGENRRGLVKKAVDDLGNDFITKCREANYIFIKVNLVDSERQLACTHVDSVRGALDVIRTYCKTPIKIGDASHYGTKASFDNLGYERLLDEYNNVELVDLNDDEFVPGFTVRRDGSQNEIRRSKIATLAQFKICIAPLKLHDEAKLDSCVYSWSVGTWIVPPRVSVSGRVWAKWPWLDQEGVEAHGASVAELYKQSACEVGIVDGIMIDRGAQSDGDIVKMGVVLAGFDAVAVDAVAGTLIGIDPHSIEYLNIISKEGLGEIDLSKINIPPMLIAQLTNRF